LHFKKTCTTIELGERLFVGGIEAANSEARFSYAKPDAGEFVNNEFRRVCYTQSFEAGTAIVI
jgi:hypothetical protein